MTRETNPQEAAESEGQKAVGRSSLTFGRVTNAPDTTSDGQHHVTVQHAGAPTDEPLPVLTPVHGDYYIPPENAPVAVLGRGGGNYSVIGSAIPEVSTPTISAGERILSHPLSDANIRFAKDGTTHLWGDGKVVINGGTQGVITDVTTTKDADGHVTSISLVRDNNILI